MVSHTRIISLERYICGYSYQDCFLRKRYLWLVIPGLFLGVQCVGQSNITVASGPAVQWQHGEKFVTLPKLSPDRSRSGEGHIIVIPRYLLRIEIYVASHTQIFAKDSALCG